MPPFIGSMVLDIDVSKCQIKSFGVNRYTEKIPKNTIKVDNNGKNTALSGVLFLSTDAKSSKPKINNHPPISE
jgi:hypothetical protein